jgi:heme oxygenase (biliverdin-IX-beta and delta-forming)
MPEIAIPTPHIVDCSLPTRQQSILRGILRDATAADHAALDATLGALDLCTAAGYRRFLEINAAALLPLERSLERSEVRDILPDWDDRARTEAILTDLARLGGKPRRLDAPDLTSRSAVLGTLYVLEGSRLGATYLLRTVRQSSDPQVSGNIAFLGHGAGRRFWPEYLAVLECHADELACDDDLVAPARRAFDLFEHAAALS